MVALFDWVYDAGTYSPVYVTSSTWRVSTDTKQVTSDSSQYARHTGSLQIRVVARKVIKLKRKSDIKTKVKNIADLVVSVRIPLDSVHV